MEQEELIKIMVKAMAPDKNWNPLLLAFAEGIIDRPESKQDCIELLKTIIVDKTFKIQDVEINIMDYLLQKLDYYISLMKNPNFLFVGDEDEKNFRYVNKELLLATAAIDPIC